MTMKTTICATAVALLAGTACFAVQAEARDPATPANQFKVSTSHGSKKLYMSAAAIYDAGVRRGDAQASRSAYLRGFRDGTSTTAYAPRQYAYAPRQYVVNSAPVYSGAPVYSAAPVYGAAPFMTPLPVIRPLRPMDILLTARLRSPDIPITAASFRQATAMAPVLPAIPITAASSP